MTESTGVCNQDIVCVLGMHRSGTSLLARILNLIGLYLGSDQVSIQPADDNPKGHWEHSDIVSLNDAILERHGGSWDEPPLLPPDWETASVIDDLRQRAQILIEDQFADVHLWGWKDPRSCLTLPFWQQLLPNMRYVICLRNPVDVAHSLHHRNSFSAEKSSSLWFRYVNSAFQHSEGKRHLIVFYEDLMDNWLRELQRMADFLGKPERAERVDVQEAVQEFVEEGLQHYRASIVQATASPRIALRAKALYIAQRIFVSFGRKEINSQQGLDHQIEKALDILNQYSFKASGQANPLIEQLAELGDQLAERGNTIRVLQSRLLEQDKDVETISARLAEREEALKMLSTQLVEKDGIVQTLSTQLVEKDGIVQTLSTQLAEKDRTVQTLSTQLAEKDRTVQTLSAELVEQNRALQSQAERSEERVGGLSAQLLDTETQLKRITDTLGWRLLSHYGRIKNRYLLPVYRLFGQVSAERTETKPLHDNPECVIAGDKGAAVDIGDGPPRRETRSVRKL